MTIEEFLKNRKCRRSDSQAVTAAHPALLLPNIYTAKTLRTSGIWLPNVIPQSLGRLSFSDVTVRFRFPLPDLIDSPVGLRISSMGCEIGSHGIDLATQLGSHVIYLAAQISPHAIDLTAQLDSHTINLSTQLSSHAVDLFVQNTDHESVFFYLPTQILMETVYPPVQSLMTFKNEVDFTSNVLQEYGNFMIFHDLNLLLLLSPFLPRLDILNSLHYS